MTSRNRFAPPSISWLASFETKAALSGVLHQDFQTGAGRTPLSLCLSRLATSVARFFLKEVRQLDLPSPLHRIGFDSARGP